MTASADSEGHPSSVGFPVSESSSRTAVQPAPQMRPFRRISLPSFPSVLHRNSIVSVSSFDSLPEDEETRPGMAISVSNPANIRLAKPTSANLGRSRPLHVESPKRRSTKRSSSTKPGNDAKALQRKQVVDEFYTTEKSYVDGLELIYSNFLTPIVTSLETSKPLLDRASLTSLFSNFIDIWNLHRSFFSALTNHLGHSPTHTPPLSPLLLSHFPYLSLYNPFITAFPSMISTLTDMTTPPSPHRPNTRYNQAFATFVSTQELDPRCRKLKLRDWLLTIVQRCPRYLLLLKDLIKCTDDDDPEYAKLSSVLGLVNKITSTLDTSLQTHAQILSLVALQRSTTGLPIQLIEPGRALLKRGSLLQVERSSSPREREFLLFSDCLIWLSSEETERAWNLGWSVSTIGDSSISSSQTTIGAKPGRRESGSEGEIHISNSVDSVEVSPTSPKRQSIVVPPVRKFTHPPPPVPRRLASTGEERWIFKGRALLVDVEVIVIPSREAGDERKFEVLSPEGSFVLYAGSQDERGDWVSEIRQAKVQRLASLNMTNPNSTLTSSSSTNHVRRSLQALPFPPSDERIATMRAVQSAIDLTDLTDFSSAPENEKDSHKGKTKGKDAIPAERRRKVEHWVPAIWIPDGKTDSCMRCGKSFNWRRRRHHCRLCGRCVCASCSGRTFFIADAKEVSSKPARACEACYETVFPLVDPPPGSANSSSFLSSSTSTSQPSNDTITSLSKLPSWVSMPSLPTSSSQPQALMFDLDHSPDLDSVGAASTSHTHDFGILGTEEREFEGVRGGRIRIKPPPRPKSYYQILEDFQHHHHHQDRHPGLSISPSSNILINSAIEENSEAPSSDGGDEILNDDSPLASSPPSMNHFSQPPSPSHRRRREDTARRSKRFSLPAVALHTANVTARTTSVSGGGSGGSGGNGSNNSRSGGASGDGGSGGESVSGGSGAAGRLRRLSLASGARN